MNKYTILIPCYNDWECLNLLIPNINEISKNIDEEVSILIINDASTIANNLSFNHMTYLKKIEPAVNAYFERFTGGRGDVGGWSPSGADLSPGGGYGQSPTGRDIAGTPFSRGGIVNLL